MYTHKVTDIAKLLAQHSVAITIAATPVNAGRSRGTVARAVESTGVRKTVAKLELSCEDADGLAKHCENLDQLSSLDQGVEFFYYMGKALEKPMEKLFEELQPKPSCVISDIRLPFTSVVAGNFGVPRNTYNGFSAFALLCLCCIHQVAEGVLITSFLYILIAASSGGRNDSMGGESSSFRFP